MSSPTLSATAKKNVETIAKVEQQLAGQRTRMDLIGDAIARFFGTLRFIIAHAVFITGWFVLNLGLFPDVQPFDPYPFPFLGLIVGIEFIFLTTFVLMNQNLQSRRGTPWVAINFQLSSFGQHLVTHNITMPH